MLDQGRKLNFFRNDVYCMLCECMMFLCILHMPNNKKTNPKENGACGDNEFLGRYMSFEVFFPTDCE